MGVRIALPEAMQAMLSASRWTGLKSSVQARITSAIGGGGEGNLESSQ